MAFRISKKKIKVLFEGLDEYLNKNYVPEDLSEICEEPALCDEISFDVDADLKNLGKPQKLGKVISDKKTQARKSESPAREAPVRDDSAAGAALNKLQIPMQGEPLTGASALMLGEAFNKTPASPAGAALGEAPAPAPAAKKAARTLDDLMKNVSQTWQESLFRLIDEKGYSDTEVYKRAKIDRKLFSKIRSNPDYQPKKNTAVAFALALKLSLDEVKDFLARAGYALSPSSRFDLIIQYFVEQEVYDLYTINLALFEHDQPLLE
ncbi:MAG: hypothetical protein K6E85_11440 [Lachnospiraceae bacterium]|nr:hypothetical protein [Lachnospiraceae bacterium]